MSSVRWHRLARTELFDSADFYDASADGLGTVFLDAVEAGLDRIRTHPQSGRRISGPWRALVISRFPYTVIYRSDHARGGRRGKNIYVIAVAHHKRRPMYWSRRF